VQSYVTEFTESFVASDDYLLCVRREREIWTHLRTAPMNAARILAEEAMKKLLFSSLVLGLCLSAAAQNASVRVKIRAALYDRDLNLKTCPEPGDEARTRAALHRSGN
jgi:hypothetical protein